MNHSDRLSGKFYEESTAGSSLGTERDDDTRHDFNDSPIFGNWYWPSTHQFDAPISCDERTYRVEMNHAVLLNAGQGYQYMMTEGLRSCVAFGLLDTVTHTGLLVHFYSLEQIKRDLSTLYSAFINLETPLSRKIKCIIAGGSSDFPSSLSMVEHIMKYTCHNIASIRNPIKLQKMAPVLLDTIDKTLTIKIDLISGEVQESILSGGSTALTIHSNPSMQRLGIGDMPPTCVEHDLTLEATQRILFNNLMPGQDKENIQQVPNKLHTIRKK